MRLLAHYPEAAHNGDTINALAEDWEEDLAVHNITMPTFMAAVKICRRECKFYPKIADVLAAAKTVDNFRDRKQIALPAQTMLTDEECQRNKRRINFLIESIGTGKTEDEVMAKIELIQ